MADDDPWLRWVAGALVLAVVTASVVWMVVRRDEPAPGTSGAPTALTALPQHIVVSLTRPSGGSAPASRGLPTPLDVRVLGERPVRGIEVWAGDELAGSVDVAPATSSVARRIAWRPATNGTILLVARVIDDAGRVGQSNPLPVRVLDPMQPLLWASVTATPEDTLDSLASRFEVDPAQLATLNPGLPATGPLPAGATVDVPVINAGGPAGPLPVPDPASGRAAGDAAFGVPLRAGGFSFPPALPVPDVTVSVEGCSVTARAHDAAAAVSTFELRVLTAGASVYEPRSRLVGTPAGTGSGATWSVPFGPGRAWVVVAALGDAGQSLSAPIAVTLPEICGGTWTGDVRLVDGFLTGGVEADHAYLYVSTDARRSWQRVPGNDQAAVGRTARGFDFRTSMPALTSSTIDLDAWGWHAGALVHIGSGSLTAPPGVELGSIVGRPQAVTLDAIDTPGGETTSPVLTREVVLDDEPVALRWSASDPMVDGAVWQVTTLPPGTEPLLAPAGLVAQGALTGHGGDFKIDPGSFSTLPVSVGSVGVTFPRAPGAPGPPATQPGPSRVPAPAYWVRVIPLAADQPGSRTSNTVHLARPDPTTEAVPDQSDGGPAPYLADYRVDPAKGPDVSRLRCWKFEGWDPARVDAAAWDAAAPNVDQAGQAGTHLLVDPGGNAYFYWFYQRVAAIYGNDTPLCGQCFVKVYGPGASCQPAVDDDDIFDVFEDIVEGLGTLWDTFVVAAWNAIKDFVIDAVATLSGCTTIVAAVSNEQAADEVCQAFATIIVDAALIAFGIPPGLPSSAELIAAAKGQLVALAVALAKSQGVPCDEIATASDASGGTLPDCEALAGQLLDELQAQMDDWFRASAQAQSGLYFPPGMKVVPWPTGQVQPARIDVTLTPNPAFTGTRPTSCSMNVRSAAAWSTGPARAGAGEVTVDVPGIVEAYAYYGHVASASIPPQTFEQAPFAVTTREVAVDPDAARTTTVYLFDPVPHDRVFTTTTFDSTNGSQSPPSFFWVPYYTYLLHEGGRQTYSFETNCFAPNDVTVVAGR